MKSISNLALTFIILLSVSCKKEHSSTKQDVKTETETQSQKPQEITNTHLLLIEKNKVDEQIETALNDLESNINEISFEAKIADNEFNYTSKEIENIMNLYAKKLAFTSNRVLDIQQLSYLNHNQNNGYNMLVYKGVCKLTQEHLSVGIGIDISAKEDDTSHYQTVKISDGSTVVCVGCKEGCEPRRDDNGDGICTPCEGDCEKTESLNF